MNREHLDIGEIFQTYSSFVWRTLRYFGVPERNLPDVTQEVFLVVHRRLTDFEGRSSVRTWIHGICRHVALGERRRAWNRRVVLAEDPLAGRETGEHGAETVERRELAGKLQQILSSIEESKRMVFVLYELEGVSMKEIAETVGCPVQTAYSRLHAARKELREAWAEDVPASAKVGS